MHSLKKVPEFEERSPNPSTTKFCEKLKNPAIATSSPANAASFGLGEYLATIRET